MPRRFRGINEYIDCACGECGQKLLKYDQYARVRKFILGHHAKGKGNPHYGKFGEDHPVFGMKHSEEFKKKVSERCKGSYMNEKNWKWKGDAVKNSGLHEYVRRHYPKTEFCEICQKVPPYDLANVTGIYNRERKNWGWFCRKCHMKYDNTIERTLKKGWGWNKKKITLA